MKLRHKILALPPLVMIIIFSFGLVVMEYQLKKELDHRYQQELMRVASMALSTVDMLNDFAELEMFDILADKIARATQTRVTFLAVNGTVLGDSGFLYQQILQMDNHANRPEVVQALETGTGMARRFSASLDQELFYFARFQEPELSEFPYIARVSITAEDYDNAVQSLRLNFLVLSAMTIGVVLVFAVISVQLLNRAVANEQGVLEQRVAIRTKEITLMQTLSALLNGSQSMVEASAVIERMLPKLMPAYHGYISLFTEHQTHLKTFVFWGDNNVADEQVFPQSCWQQEVTKVISLPLCSEKLCEQNNCQLGQQSLCVALVAQGNWLGVLHLIAEQEEVTTEQDLALAISAGEQISMAFANILLRDSLREQATVDPLTGLYNRRFMIEALEKQLSLAARSNTAVAVMMLDVDHFKAFNDTYGHDAGDLVLVKVAATLKQNLRLTDISCRYGGEEFCVICPETSKKHVFDVAEKVRQLISVLYLNHKGKELGQVTASIGVAVFPEHGQSYQSLLKHADKALYKAKAKGRKGEIRFRFIQTAIAATLNKIANHYLVLAKSCFAVFLPRLHPM
jgi:diguanylate cyclase (GGDEF)-like protein